MAVEEYSNHVGLLPHALDYLLRLKEHGIKLAVATGLPEKLYMPWAYPQVGRSGAGGSVQYRDQSYDAEKCPSENSAASAVPDDQLLLHVFGLHAAHTGRVGGV